MLKRMSGGHSLAAGLDGGNTLRIFPLRERCGTESLPAEMEQTALNFVRANPDAPPSYQFFGFFRKGAAIRSHISSGAS